MKLLDRMNEAIGFDFISRTSRPLIDAKRWALVCDRWRRGARKPPWFDAKVRKLGNSDLRVLLVSVYGFNLVVEV